MKHKLSANAKLIMELAAAVCIIGVFIANTVPRVKPYIDTWSYNENDPPRTYVHQTHEITEWAEGMEPVETTVQPQQIGEMLPDRPATADLPEAADPTTDLPETSVQSMAQSEEAAAAEEYPKPPESSATTAGSAPTEKTHAETAPAENEGLVNINTASLEELMELKGIGEVKGNAIIAYREAHGGFSSVDELINVKGIGEKTLENLRAYITV